MGVGPARRATALLDALWHDLRRGLATHLPYAALAGTVLVGSVLAGALFLNDGAGLSSLPLRGITSNVFPEERPALELLGADADLFSLLAVGAVTVGFLTGIGLVTQGLVTGYLLAASAGDLGPAFLFVAVVPQGLPKLFGFVLAAAVSFRLVAAGVSRLLGLRNRFLDDEEWRRTGLVLGCGALSLAVAALIEAHVTFRLIEQLF